MNLLKFHFSICNDSITDYMLENLFGYLIADNDFTAVESP